MTARRHAAALMILLLAGCASKMDYKVLDAQMASGNCQDAGAYMESMQQGYGANQQLVYHMDMGMLKLYCGDYAGSAEQFQEADDIARDLWTKSVSKEGVSFLTNDYTIPYSGEDYEKVMINLFHSISSAAEGDFESALVEARQLNQLLMEINEAYERKSVYREDAFARYMSAMMYEAENPRDVQNLDSATIDYEKGSEVYGTYEDEYGTPVPAAFIEDFYRVAEAAGRLEDRKSKKKDVQWLSHKKARDMGRVVMLHLSGRVPAKEEEAVTAIAPHGPIKVAFPKFGPPHPGCTDSSVVVSSPEGAKYTAGSELVEDIGAIAVKNLADRRGRVVAKTIARAIAKQAAIEAAASQADNKQQEMLTRFVGRVVAAVTEVADTRSWRTLPDKIYMARTFVPEGRYSIKAEFCGNIREMAEEMEIKAGQTTFVLLQNVY